MKKKPFFPVVPVAAIKPRARSAERDRADRLAALDPIGTLTPEELELIEIYRAAQPTWRAALLTIVRMQTEKGGA